MSTKSTKNVELIVPPPTPHFVGDGFRVHNFIPSRFRLDMQRMDPFLVMDYNSKHYFPPAEVPRGVDVHPHRGFETVTIAYKGRIAHTDNAGGGGIIGQGDVQWMTAASGVLHKEFHEESFSRAGGDFQMVQLWVNLPAKHKMAPPKYQAIAHEQMGRYDLGETNGYIEIISGQYADVKGPANTFSPVHLMNAKLKKGGRADFQFPAAYGTCLLAIEGSFRVNGGEEVPTDHFVLMDQAGEHFEIEATEQAIVLVLSGQPLNEPIAAHGPFVMNTQAELLQAFEDFNSGRFGEL